MLRAITTYAAVLTVALTGAGTAHSQSTAQVRSLRQGISWHRTTTWHYQDEARVRRTPTAHAERRTTSVPFLRWIDQLWSHRRIAAKKQAARALAHPPTPKAYARLLAMRTWHSAAEWNALDEVVTPESNWDPCVHYPSTHDCGYAGSNACGIPQRYYCPTAWRGDLWGTRWAQVRELIRYVSSRYGDPLHALAVRQSTGSY